MHALFENECVVQRSRGERVCCTKDTPVEGERMIQGARGGQVYGTHTRLSRSNVWHHHAPSRSTKERGEEEGWGREEVKKGERAEGRGKGGDKGGKKEWRREVSSLVPLAPPLQPNGLLTWRVPPRPPHRTLGPLAAAVAAGGLLIM